MKKPKSTIMFKQNRLELELEYKKYMIEYWAWLEQVSREKP